MGIFIDPKSLPSGFGGCCQVVFLGCVYSFVLYNASNLIADGSELLLLIPGWDKLVGSVVLPILGAVPDGAMVFFSGLGENAQNEIAVGVGTLAGSTVMLLTLPFAMSIINGLVPTRADGSPDYSKRNLRIASNRSGAAASSQTVARSGTFIGLTMVSYFVVQIPASYYAYERWSRNSAKRGEAYFLVLAIIACVVLFTYYIWLCYSDSTAPNTVVFMSKRNIKSVELLKNGIMNLQDLLDEQERHQASGGSRELTFSSPLLNEDEHVARFRKELMSVITPLFEECDYNGDGVIQYEEAYHLLMCFGGSTDPIALRVIFEQYDSDISGGLDVDEFGDLVLAYITRRTDRSRLLKLETQAHKAENEAEEEESVPEDLAHLDPETRATRLRNRAFLMLILGTGLVLSFSDPMVGVLNELGARSGIPSFYLAFVVAPLASNAAEAMASCQFSKKKTEQTMEVSLTALTGAAIMNNTFCLLVFLVLTLVRNLEWTFGPEVISIIFVELTMVYMTQKRYYTVRDAYIILSLFPISLMIVSVLK